MRAWRDMTEWDKFFISLAVLIVSTVSMPTFFFWSVIRFSGPGRSLDWIYLVESVMGVVWFASFISTLGRWPPE